MLIRLLLLFTVVPLAELALLMWIADHTSLWLTIGLVLLTGVLGASLARWQGIRTLWRLRDEILAGRLPAESLLDGMLILVAGALLVTPGLLTDLVGFALLVPPVRAWVRRRALRRIEVAVTTYRFRRGTSGPRPTGDRIIDVRLVDPANGKEPDEPGSGSA